MVAARIRRALPFVAKERVILAPDCGTKSLPREVAVGKLQANASSAEFAVGVRGGVRSRRRGCMKTVAMEGLLATLSGRLNDEIQRLEAGVRQNSARAEPVAQPGAA